MDFRTGESHHLSRIDWKPVAPVFCTVDLSFAARVSLAWVAMMSLRRNLGGRRPPGMCAHGSTLGVCRHIRGTPHKNPTRAREAVNAEEVCVFCHTPQIPVGPSVERSAGVAQPAWQPSLPGNHAFVMYDRHRTAPVRRQGRSGFPIHRLPVLPRRQSGLFRDGGRLRPPFRYSLPGIFPRAGTAGGRRRQGRRGPSSRAARHLKSLDQFRLPSRGMVDNRSVWWVSSAGPSALRTRGDLPHARAAPGGEIPYVECSSCHDPHSETDFSCASATRGAVSASPVMTNDVSP